VKNLRVLVKEKKEEYKIHFLPRAMREVSEMLAYLPTFKNQGFLPISDFSAPRNSTIKSTTLTGIK
jgi:hypothetical protein